LTGIEELQTSSGYEDANDYDTLRDDMILKICTSIAPEFFLSSQPNMSRVENSLSHKELYIKEHKTS
jgi:hypothetical protein